MVEDEWSKFLKFAASCLRDEDKNTAITSLIIEKMLFRIFLEPTRSYLRTSNRRISCRLGSARATLRNTVNLQSRMKIPRAVHRGFRTKFSPGQLFHFRSIIGVMLRNALTIHNIINSKSLLYPEGIRRSKSVIQKREQRLVLQQRFGKRIQILQRGKQFTYHGGNITAT